MHVGLHFLGEDDSAVRFGAATFLDVAGAGPGMRSAERLVRLYGKGRPQPREIAQKASAWHGQGCRVQLGNEPNLASEGFGGGLADYAAWFHAVKAQLPGARLYWAGMSPGVPGWRDWYAADLVAPADGIAAHAYGSVDEMRAVVEALLPLGKPLWLAEVNFGAGRSVDRDAWAREHLHPFLDWCADQPLVEAVTYFAHRWPTPDMALATPVDAAGTAIEAELAAFVARRWRASQVAPAAPNAPPNAHQPAVTAETTQESPMTTTRGVDISNNNGPNVDLRALWDDGYRFVAIKASQDTADGGFRDQDFAHYWRDAGEIGFARIAYHMTDPRYASPAQSVTLVQEVVNAAGGLATGDAVAVDVELGQTDPVWLAETLALASEVFEHLVWKYSGDWYTSQEGLENADLARYPSWFVGRPGDPEQVGWSPVRMWQRTLGAGSVRGVPGEVDVDTFLGSLDELLALGKPVPAVESIPVEPPHNSPVVPPEVTAALATLWDYVGPDVGKQEAIVAVKVALGIQEVA